jgi:hypothetical protein
MKRWNPAAPIESAAGTRESRNRIRRRGQSRLAVGALTIALVGALVLPAAQPANAAATPVIDSFLSNISVTSYTDPSFPMHPGVNIQYNRLRTLDKSVGIQVSINYPRAARTSAVINSWAVYGAAGSGGNKQAAGVGILGPLRITFSLHVPGVNEEKDFYVLNSPGSRTYTTNVDAALVKANVLAQHVPGVALMFLPATKVIKVLGTTVEGWTIYSDISNALNGAYSPCPPLAVGQVVVTTTSPTISGDTLIYKANTKVWVNQAARASGGAPFCNISYEMLRYN